MGNHPEVSNERLLRVRSDRELSSTGNARDDEHDAATLVRRAGVQGFRVCVHGVVVAVFEELASFGALS